KSIRFLLLPTTIVRPLSSLAKFSSVISKDDIRHSTSSPSPTQHDCWSIARSSGGSEATSGLCGLAPPAAFRPSSGRVVRRGRRIFMMDFLHVKWCLIALLAIAAIAAPAHAQIFPNKTIAEPPNSRSPTGTNVPPGCDRPGFCDARKAQNALHTLIHQRRLTPSCGGLAPTAERTMDPARIFTESLTPRPELENSQGH